VTHATYRFRNHKLKPDRLDPALFAVECKNCGQSSEGSEDAAEGTQWAADHLKANPGHLTYREHITRAYRFEPAEWL
jgi:hypothetical protein